MDKAQSKYRNTAELMDQALLILLEKKDLEYITIKELCAKAGVNRSTFYLHYENMNDLFNETIEYLNKDFLSSFPVKEMTNGILTKKPEDMVFIKEEFIVPYLKFVKNNKRIMKMIHNKPFIFKNDQIFEKMKEELFIPATEKFKVPKEDQPYIIEFFTRGVVGIVSKWIDDDCDLSIDKILDLIVGCVGVKF